MMWPRTLLGQRSFLSNWPRHKFLWPRPRCWWSTASATLSVAAICCYRGTWRMERCRRSSAARRKNSRRKEWINRWEVVPASSSWVSQRIRAYHYLYGYGCGQVISEHGGKFCCFVLPICGATPIEQNQDFFSFTMRTFAHVVATKCAIAVTLSMIIKWDQTGFDKAPTVLLESIVLSFNTQSHTPECSCQNFRWRFSAASVRHNTLLHRVPEKYVASDRFLCSTGEESGTLVGNENTISHFFFSFRGNNEPYPHSRLWVFLHGSWDTKQHLDGHPESETAMASIVLCAASIFVLSHQTDRIRQLNETLWEYSDNIPRPSPVPVTIVSSWYCKLPTPFTSFFFLTGGTTAVS